MLYGNQRLMYCGLLRPIHGLKFEPVSRKPQAPRPRERRAASRLKKEPRPLKGRGRCVPFARGYFAGAVEVSDDEAVDFDVFALLWCFLWCGLAAAVDVSADGVGDGASAANTGPAIRASATTGMSCLNIDVVSRVKKTGCVLWRVPDRRVLSLPRPPTAKASPQLQSARIMTGFFGAKARMTTT
jgi:hypothetical protein